MVKLFLAIWIFLGSLFGINHQPPAQHSSQPTATPTPLPTPLPTPTLAPGQIKTIYTFYIQATSHKINSKGLGLDPSDSGKTFVVDIGTLIILKNFGMGSFYISLSSPQNIFTNPNPGKLPGSVPINAIDDLGVFRSGYGTITVKETK